MSEPQPEPSTSRTPVTAEPEAAKPPEQPVPAAHEPSTAANSDKATRNTDTNGDEELRRLERPPETQKIENPEWGLKEIVWPPEPWENEPQRAVKIVTQNANGPCSFIAICNILILRGHIRISPPDRQSASYEYLSALVGDYLVNTALEIDIDAVFSILPKTQYGLDLNPLFTGISSFRPAGEGGELKLFDLAGIKLVHGWIADPDSQEYRALSKTEDYDRSMDAVAIADSLTSGQLVYSQSQQELQDTPTSPKSATLSDEDKIKVEDALLIQNWLEQNPTQLTYYGLFALNDSPHIGPNELVCLFRGSHLSVLYKRPLYHVSDTISSAPVAGSSNAINLHDTSSMLYTLVTDRVFLREQSVVWESLVDVDGQSSSFFDSQFRRSSPAGGDFAGQTGEQVARMYDRREEEEAINLDLRLAHQLQLQEQEYAQREYEERRRRYEERQVQKEQQQYAEANKKDKKKKKDKGDCIIM